MLNLRKGFNLYAQRIDEYALDHKDHLNTSQASHREMLDAALEVLTTESQGQNLDLYLLIAQAKPIEV